MPAAGLPAYHQRLIAEAINASPMTHGSGHSVTCQPGNKGIAKSGDATRIFNARAMRSAPIAAAIVVCGHYTPVVVGTLPSWVFAAP